MKVQRTIVRLLGATSLLASVAAQPALAQDAAAGPDPVAAADAQGGGEAEPVQANGGLLGDIVVTAQKRSQNIQNVGIAITAASGEQLTALGLSDSVDIAKIAPNVSVSGSYGGMMSQFTIRGVTQNDFNDHVESVIATYVDDTYIAMQQGQMFTMFDLDRVEALKGPQGTLFGRNATGGLVHFITRRPTDTFEGYVDATYASYDQVRVEGAVGGPLAEGLSARLSGLYERSDGYLKNLYPEQTFTPDTGRPQGAFPAPGAGHDLGGVKSNVAVRGQVLADVADNAQFWVAGFYNKFTASSAPYQQPVTTVTVQDAAGNQINTIFATPDQLCQIIRDGVCAPGFGETTPTRAVPGANYFGYNDPDGYGLKTSSDYAFDDGSRTKTWGASSKLTVDLGEVNLTWISDYKNYYKHFDFDLTADPANGYFWIAQSKEDTFSQELRLDGKTGRLTWVAGAYYLRIDNHSVHGLGALPNSAYAVGGVGFDQPRIADLLSKSYSLFGQVEYELTDTLTLIGGLRAGRERKDYDFEVLFVPTTAAASDPRAWDYAGGISSGSFSAKNSKTLWNWKAQLNWKPMDDLLLYAGVTQGAKAGSYNSGDPSLFANNGADIPYKPERLVSYEAGFKSSLFDRRLRFNASAYYYDYHNYQAARWTGLSSVIINADAYFYGAEAELIGSVTPDLDLSVNVGWQKNKVKDVPVGAGFADRETTFAPEWTASGLLRYTIPVEIAGGKIAVQGSASYQSAVWQNLNNFDANRLKGHLLVDARISWTSLDDKFTLAAFAKNIFDKRYDTIGFDESLLTGANLNSPGKPQWFGVNARVNF